MQAQAMVERGEGKIQIFYIKDFEKLLSFLGFRVNNNLDTKHTVEDVIGRPLTPTVYDEVYVETPFESHRNVVLTDDIGEGELSKFRSYGAVEHFLLGERQFMSIPPQGMDLYPDRPHKRVHIKIPPTRMITRHFPNGAYLSAFEKVSDEKTRGAMSGEEKIEYTGFIRDAWPAFYTFCKNHGYQVPQELVVYQAKGSLVDRISGK